MSDKYAALRAAKPYRADGGDIGSGRIKEIADNVYGDEEKSWLAGRVLALLAEREADKARIAELSTKRANGVEKLQSELVQARIRVEAAERRIAELESRKVKLPGGWAVRSGHPINEGERGVLIPKDGGQWLARFDVEHAIQVAGITLEAGE